MEKKTISDHPFYLEKIIYGVGLMLAGVIGFAGVLVFDGIALHTQVSVLKEIGALKSAGVFPVSTSLSPWLSTFPMLFFLIVAVLGFRTAARAHNDIRKQEEGNSPKPKTLSEQIQEHANEEKETELEK